MSNDPRLNPFQSPTEVPVEARVVGVNSGSREDLRKVASYQRFAILAILVQIVTYGALMAKLVPQDLVLPVSLVWVLAILVGTVFAILLAMRLYSVGFGIVFGIATLVPCIGLIALLCINQRAIKVLQQNGVKVGFLGANPNSV